MLTTILLYGVVSQEIIGHLRYDSINNDLFLKILGPRRVTPHLQTLEDIETEANNITQSLHTALLAAYPRASGKQRGTAWWNDECKDAAYRYGQVRLIGQADVTGYA